MENKTVCKFRSKIEDIDRNSTLNIETFQRGWSQFCLVDVTSMISSDSMYPNPCFALQLSTKYTHQLLYCNTTYDFGL